MLDRLISNKKPINYIDEAALIHDIDYMNPYISKSEADYNMVTNLTATGSIATALTTKLILKLFNRLGSKESNLIDYQLARDMAEKKNFINPNMHFTKYKIQDITIQ